MEKRNGSPPPPAQGNVPDDMKFTAENVFDPEFREWMQADPRAAMSSRGVDIASDMDIRVHVNTDDTFYAVLPPATTPSASSDRAMFGSGGKTA